MKIELKEAWPGCCDIEFTQWNGESLRETLLQSDAEELINELEHAAEELRRLYNL